MMIAYSREELESYVLLAIEAARDAGTQTILVDEFLKDAIEVEHVKHCVWECGCMGVWV